MVVPFMLEYGREFGDSTYTDAEAVKQLTVYASHLQQPDGLLQHAWDESKTASWSDPKTGLSPEQWCRANGWFGMALVTALDDVPATQPGRATLLPPCRRIHGAASHVTAQFPDTLSDSRVILSSRRDPPCDTLHKN